MSPLHAFFIKPSTLASPLSVYLSPKVSPSSERFKIRSLTLLATPKKAKINTRLSGYPECEMKLIKAPLWGLLLIFAVFVRCCGDRVSSFVLFEKKFWPKNKIYRRTKILFFNKLRTKKLLISLKKKKKYKWNLLFLNAWNNLSLTLQFANV